MSDDVLRRAHAALVGRAPSEALALLDALTPTGRAGFDGRVAAWRAEALDALGRLDEAERSAAAAVRIGRDAGDAEAVAAYRGLHQRILGGLAAVRIGEVERAKDAFLADADETALLAGVDGAARAALLTRRAGALVDAGRGAEGRAAARRAFTEAAAVGDPREQVFALLAELRAAPAEGLVLLARAHTIADTADDPNLVTAVARAARAAGVRLPSPEFP